MEGEGSHVRYSGEVLMEGEGSHVRYSGEVHAIWTLPLPRQQVIIPRVGEGSVRKRRCSLPARLPLNDLRATLANIRHSVPRLRRYFGNLSRCSHDLLYSARSSALPPSCSPVCSRFRPSARPPVRPSAPSFSHLKISSPVRQTAVLQARAD